MEDQWPVSTALHILVDYDNVVGWRLVLNYMQTTPTNYYLESSVRAAYVGLTLRTLNYTTRYLFDTFPNNLIF